MIVSRTINGVTKRYVEYMAAEYQTGDDREDVFYVDAGLTYDSSPASTIYGLDHLEGETVRVVSDGAAHPDETVANGEITLDRDASVVHAGLATRMRYCSFRMEAGARDGTSQTKTKRITDLAFRFFETLGGKAGPDFDNMDDIPEVMYRAPITPMGTPPPLFSGDTLMSWPGGYETDGSICYENDSGFPVTMVAFVPQVVTQDAR